MQTWCQTIGKSTVYIRVYFDEVSAKKRVTSSDYSTHWCKNPIYRCSGYKRLSKQLDTLWPSVWPESPSYLHSLFLLGGMQQNIDTYISLTHQAVREAHHHDKTTPLTCLHHHLQTFLDTPSVKQKVKFLYSAVSNPQDRSKRFTLCFRAVHSDTILASLGSIQSYATINARTHIHHCL